MANPFDTVLSSFTGADETPLSEGSTWTATAVDGTTNRLQRVGNQCSSAVAGVGSQLWGTAFAADQMVRLGMGTSLGGCGIYWRIANGNTATYNGYVCTYDGSNIAQVYRVDAGVATALGAAITVGALAASDAFGVTHVGSTITVFKRVSGVESSLTTRTDGTYNATGSIGLYVADNATRVDQFGGGTIAGAPVNTVAPAVTGTPAVGKVLSCTTGTWTGDVSSGYAYQWKRETGVGSGAYTSIGAATASTYTQVNADRALRLQCVVTATGTGGSTPATSNVVGPTGTSTGTVVATWRLQTEVVIEAKVAAIKTQSDDAALLVAVIL